MDELFAKEVPDIVSIILPVGHNPETVIACAEAGGQGGFVRKADSRRTFTGG